MSWFRRRRARIEARQLRRRRVEELVSWVCLPVIAGLGWLIYDQVRTVADKPSPGQAQEERAQPARTISTRPPAPSR